MSTKSAEIDKLFEERQKTSGGRIREARKKERYSQEQAAEELQKDRSTISNWERGFSTPPIDIYIEMSMLYKTPVYDLMALDVLDEGQVQEKIDDLNRQLDELESEANDLNKSLEDQDDLPEIAESLKRLVSLYVNIMKPNRSDD